MIEYGTWAVLSVAVGLWAQRKGRNAIGWTVAALAISPMIAAALLLFMPNNKPLHLR